MSNSPRQLTLDLDLELITGNDGQGHHWGRTHTWKQNATAAILQASTRAERKPFANPVSIVITRVLRKRQRLVDPGNLATGNAKQILDALVTTGILPDDNASIVQRLTYLQDASQRGEKPRVRISLTEVLP